MLQCEVPENIHTSPTEGTFSKTSPHPSGKSNLSVGGVWLFSEVIKCKEILQLTSRKDSEALEPRLAHSCWSLSRFL